MNKAREQRDVLRLIDEQVDNISQTLANLAAIPAVGTTGEGYPEIVALLSKKLSEAGLDTEAIDIPSDYVTGHWGADLEKITEYTRVTRLASRAIVLGRYKGARSGAPSLHLTQHYDMPGPLAVAHPGTAEVTDGRIAAPAVSFCRAGIVAMLAAAKALTQAGIPLAGDLFVSFTPDTHMGGETGAGYLVEQHLGRSHWVITGSEGGPDTLVLGYKGDLFLKITTRGKSVSADAPHLGINAIDKMATVQRALAELEPKFMKRESRWPIIPRESARPTMVFSQIRSSGSAQVPDTCILTVDLRVVPEETTAEVFEEIMEIIRSLQSKDKDLNVEVNPVHVTEPAVTESDAPLAEALRRNVREVLGVEPRTAVHAYYTEFRLFREHWGAQTINYGPGRPERMKGQPENVLVSDVVSTAKVLALTARDLLTPTGSSSGEPRSRASN